MLPSSPKPPCAASPWLPASCQTATICFSSLYIFLLWRAQADTVIGWLVVWGPRLLRFGIVLRFIVLQHIAALDFFSLLSSILLYGYTTVVYYWLVGWSVLVPGRCAYECGCWCDHFRKAPCQQMLSFLLTNASGNWPFMNPPRCFL